MFGISDALLSNSNTHHKWKKKIVEGFLPEMRPKRRLESSQWAWCFGYFFISFSSATAHPAAPTLPVSIHRRHHLIVAGTAMSIGVE